MRLILIKRICISLLWVSFALRGAPAWAEEASAIAMHGAPRLADGFKNFSYVNPEAPKGGELVIGTTGTFDSLNPFIVRGNPALGLATGFMSMVYESLMARNWDEPFTLYGLIAQSVDVPENRESIAFTLNPDAYWQDGKPITAEDVLFSYETLRDKGRPNHRMYYKKIEKAEILGDRRIRFAFKRNADGNIDREMPLIMGLMPILPKHIWQGREFNQTTMQIPVGSGPYKVVKVDPGRSIVYERDPGYWGRDVPAQKGHNNFDRVKVDYYRDDAVALQAFKSGQFDLRRENDPNKWAIAYDFPAAHDGRVKLESFKHQRTEAISGFILNTRHDLFKDKSLRKAMAYAFDFGWINKNLFHGLYKRSMSLFPNSELATSPASPAGAELTLLEKFRDRLDEDIFTKSVAPPSADGSEESLRENLLAAASLLKRAGYVLKNGKLYKDNAPVEFEVMLNDPIEEKVALQWARALKQLGINARVRTVDSAQYQARLAGFDFDVTVGKWYNSLSPGNEQMLFWGSAAAKQQGSRNYPGISDPVVDALASAIMTAQTREELVTATHALDRVLLEGAYIVPFYHLGADQIAYRSKLKHPSTSPLYGPIIETWWTDK